MDHQTRKLIADALADVASVLSGHAVSAENQPTPKSAKLHLQPRVAFALVPEGWWAVGPAVYSQKRLDPRTAEMLTRRARESSQYVGSLALDTKLRMTFLDEIKDGGVRYFIYRFKDAVRFVPASTKPPKILYISHQSAQEPRLEGEVGPIFTRLGRVDLPHRLAKHMLTDAANEADRTFFVLPSILSPEAADRVAVMLNTKELVDDFESTRLSPEFRRWFVGASDLVRNKDGTPKVFYRGQTGGSGSLQARLVLDSFTDSPGIASLYSTTAGEIGTGSNVMPVYLNMSNPLVIPHVFLTFYDVLNLLGFWKDGIDNEDVTKMLNYLVNRDKAASLASWEAPKGLKNFVGMPSFKVQLRDASDMDDYDEDADEDYDIFDDIFKSPLQNFRNALENALEYPDEDEINKLTLRLAVDTFALVETPAFKRAVEKLGYDGIVHRDSLADTDRVKEFFGVEDLTDVAGVEEGSEDYDWDEMATTHEHWTYRPLSRDQVWPLLQTKRDT